LSRRKLSSVIPFGYVISKDHPSLLDEVPEQIEALEEISNLVMEKVLSLREGATWLEHKTGRKISHQGLKKIIDGRLGT
jgi:hypothetical protein